MDYKKLYYLMFNAVTDAVRLLDDKNTEQARERLAEAQCKAEEIYINGSEEQ